MELQDYLQFVVLLILCLCVGGFLAARLDAYLDRLEEKKNRKRNGRKEQE